MHVIVIVARFTLLVVSNNADHATHCWISTMEYFVISWCACCAYVCACLLNSKAAQARWRRVSADTPGFSPHVFWVWVAAPFAGVPVDTTHLPCEDGRQSVTCNRYSVQCWPTDERLLQSSSVFSRTRRVNYVLRIVLGPDTEGGDSFISNLIPSPLRLRVTSMPL